MKYYPQCHWPCANLQSTDTKGNTLSNPICRSYHRFLHDKSIMKFDVCKRYKPIKGVVK